MESLVFGTKTQGLFVWFIILALTFDDKKGFNFYRTKLKTPDLTGDQPITCCAIDARGKMFAYALSYDWHKVKIILYCLFY